MPEPVAPLVATQDGLHLFAGGISGHIHSIAIPSGDIIQSFAAHRKPITCLETNDDGSLLVSGSDDGTILVSPIHQLLDSLSCKNLIHSAMQRLVGHESSVTAITTGIGGCNCTIISCSLDCTCKFWSLMHKKPLRTVLFPCTTRGVAVDPLESEFFVAGSDGLIYKGALKLTTRPGAKQGRRMIAWNKQEGGPIASITTINWGQNLVTASEDGSVCIWDVKQGELMQVLEQQPGSISNLLVARGQNDGSLHMARMNEGIADLGTKIELGSSVKELSRPIKDLMQMQQQLDVAVKDRRRAIDTLELAIGAYEKLLKLIVKEAKAGSSYNSDDADDDHAV